MLFGMVGAINICRGLALAAGLDNELSFYPWLSDSESSPSTEFFRSRGRYVLPDMVTVIADDWDDFTDGELQNPINMDENGEFVEAETVWTSTLPSGEPNPEFDFCEDWTEKAAAGRRGRTNRTDSWWTEFPEKNPCGADARLFCVEQE
jgi:hypothetical protein